MLTDRESLAACSFYQFPPRCQQVVNKTSAGLLFVLALGLQLRLSSDGYRGLMDIQGPGGASSHHSGQGTHPSIFTPCLRAFQRQEEAQGTVCFSGVAASPQGNKLLPDVSWA